MKQIRIRWTASVPRYQRHTKRVTWRVAQPRLRPVHQEIPSVGLGLARLREFVQRGWRGKLLSGDRQNRGSSDEETTSATVGKSGGGEQLNHERPNRIGKGGLASEILRRRSRMANVRLGTVPLASGFVGGNLARRRQESAACRKTARTQMDRAVTRPSNVTSGLKTDANAGTTAASGNGNPVPGLVGQVIQTP